MEVMVATAGFVKGVLHARHILDVDDAPLHVGDGIVFHRLYFTPKHIDPENGLPVAGRQRTRGLGNVVAIKRVTYLQDGDAIGRKFLPIHEDLHLPAVAAEGLHREDEGAYGLEAIGDRVVGELAQPLLIPASIAGQ